MYPLRLSPTLLSTIRKKTCCKKIDLPKFKGKIVCYSKKYIQSWAKNPLSNHKNSNVTTPSTTNDNAWTKVSTKSTEKNNSETFKSKMPNSSKESWTKSLITTQKNLKKTGKNKNKSSKTSPITHLSLETEFTREEKNLWPLTLCTSPVLQPTSSRKITCYLHLSNLSGSGICRATIFWSLSSTMGTVCRFSATTSRPKKSRSSKSPRKKALNLFNTNAMVKSSWYLSVSDTIQIKRCFTWSGKKLIWTGKTKKKIKRKKSTLTMGLLRILSQNNYKMKIKKDWKNDKWAT